MAGGDDSDRSALLFIYTEHTAANWSLVRDTAWMRMNRGRMGVVRWREKGENQEKASTLQLSTCVLKPPFLHYSCTTLLYGSALFQFN